MCLAVVNDFQIQTVESPIIVYKEAFYDESDKIAISKYQEFVYRLNKIETCSEPFSTVYCDRPLSFYLHDTREATAVNEYFGAEQNVTDISKLCDLWLTHHFELIQTGFHFCFGDGRQLRDISKMCQFLIPVGAHIVIGIDETLGVTDQIMLI